MKLALLGGTPIRAKPFPAYVTVGEEEKEATCRVIDSGVLSRYLGAWHEQFMGGPEVRALESEWAAHYGVKHAVAVNSASSGLICALGAAGVGPGDEVVVTPWSMSISATAPLFYGGIPVFADVEKDCFCLDADDVERKITPKTKAVIVVDLFGQPYDATRINALAKKHNLTVIEDAAQAPGALLDGKPAGTLGHMGVYSLNYHKHIHSGEGGVVVTNDDNLAERLQLIRNHAEAVVEGKGIANLANMLGFNMRMTELDAAVVRCQLSKLAGLNHKRLANVAYLEEGLTRIPCLTLPAVRAGAKHVYYVHACLYDKQTAAIPVRRFVEAVKAELPPFALREKEGTKLGAGYVKPLYLMPLFQQKIAIGSEGWPFTLAQERKYAKGECPVCETLYEGGLFTHEFMLPCMEKTDLDDVLEAFDKIWSCRGQLA
jgi:dTDP-4-amino-4,6-dideoxygalactose transaminase